MKRNKVVAPAVVHVRSEASHHPYHHSIGAMFCVLVSLCGLLALAARPAAAQITVGGDPGEVSPADPSTWTSVNTFSQTGINSGKSGTITVAGGSSVSSYWDDLGVGPGSRGAISITGPGSSWTNRYELRVGVSGAGELTVESGGKLSSAVCYLGVNSGSTGTGVVTGPGSSWTSSVGLSVGSDAGAGSLTVENGGTVTAGTLVASPSDLKGDGTINVHGLTSDMDMVFDGTYGASDVLSFGSGGTLNVNLDGTGSLGVGYHGTGSLRVADGVKITTHQSYLGYYAGASGTAIITGTGSTWTSGGHALYVGRVGTGMLRVENGGAVNAAMCLGQGSGSSGSVVISGPGSAWNSDSPGDSYVGYRGTGTLRVEDGGTVSNEYATSTIAGTGSSVTITGAGSTWVCGGGLGVAPGGSLTVENGGAVTSGEGSQVGGQVIVTGPGSLWTNRSLYVDGTGTVTVESGGTVTTGTLCASPSSLKGDGTINATGMMCNMDLVLDATHGATQAFSFGTGGVLNLNLNASSSLGTGYGGVGSLRIADGVKASSMSGYVGYLGGRGEAVITGPGTSWNVSGDFHVGEYGTGRLRVENGATISGGYGLLGYYDTTSHGVATVTGAGSTWTSSITFGVGWGTLTVGDGGKVMARGLSADVSTSSVVNLHVSGDGMIVLGNATIAGSFWNSCKVNLYADAFLAARAYSPITAFQGQTIVWGGTGSYNAFGGTWSNASKTFTVAAAALGDAGVSCDLTSAERLLITDSATLRRVGASFGNVADGTNFTATPLSGDDLTGLPADQPLLAAWNFSTNFTGDQALLAFDVGAGRMQDLAVWHYDGARWTYFDAFDLTYGDDGIASFAVTGFGSYAVTVPEPGCMAVVLLAGFAMLRRKSGCTGW